MPKSPDAFRTISEVADWLGIQAHVLRFWESKFTQVKPIKRAGGRRYYRPADMQLLGGIRKLLHDDGLTIKGVQKILREEGMSHVASMSVPLDEADMDVDMAAPAAAAPKARIIPEPEEAVVLPFEAPKEPERVVEPAKLEQTAEAEAQAPDTFESKPEDDKSVSEPENRPQATEPKSINAVTDQPVEPDDAPSTETAPKAVEAETSSKLEADAPTVKDVPERLESTTDTPDATSEDDAPQAEMKEDPSLVVEEAEAADAPEEGETAKEAMSPLPSFLRKPAAEIEATPEAVDEAPEPDIEAQPDTPEPEPEMIAPEIAQPEEPASEAVETEPDAAQDGADEPVQEKTSRPRARDIGMPAVTPEHEIHAEPATLSRGSRLSHIDAASAQKIQPLLAQLTALKDRMAARAGSAHPKS